MSNKTTEQLIEDADKLTQQQEEKKKKRQFGTIGQALFPSAQAPGWGKVPGLVSDIMTIPGALIQESFATQSKGPEEGLQRVGEREGILASPELAGGVLASRLPIMKKLLSKGAWGKMGAGGVEGLGAGTAGEMRRLGTEGRISPSMMALQTALGAILPGVGFAMRKGGQSLIQPLVKPIKGVKQQFRKKGTNIGEAIFKPVQTEAGEMGYTSALPFKGAVEGIEKRAFQIEKQLNKEFTSVMNAHKGTKVNVQAAYNRAVEKMRSEMDEAIHMDVGADAMEKAAESWMDKFIPFTKGKNTTPLRIAENLKKSIAGKDGANFKEVAGDAALNAKARFARRFYKEIREEIHNKVPALQNLDQSLSDGYPIEAAVSDAVDRLNNNFALGLKDTIILASLGTGLLAGGGQMEQGWGKHGMEGGGAAMLGLLLLSKLSGSSTFATQLVKGGGGMMSPLGRQLTTRPLGYGAEMMINPREEAIERAVE